MTALTLDLPDEKLRRLEALAEARGTNIVQLIEEVSTVVLAQADGEARFRLRAQRDGALAQLRRENGHRHQVPSPPASAR